LSPSGDYLAVIHTADHRLVVYYVGGSQPVKIAKVMVGVEPVSVRALDDDTFWVISHISDSINIVSLQQRNVVRTLLVGDEPTDVVFANGKAFVSVSQEDRVRVYDLNDLDAAPTDIPLLASDPRSLAVSPAGNTVYVTALDSGNRTTAIHFEVVDAFGGPPPPDPPMNPALPPAPRTSLIVRHDGAQWLDVLGDVPVLGMISRLVDLCRQTGVSSDLLRIPEAFWIAYLRNNQEAKVEANTADIQ